MIADHVLGDQGIQCCARGHTGTALLHLLQIKITEQYECPRQKFLKSLNKSAVFEKSYSEFCVALARMFLVAKEMHWDLVSLNFFMSVLLELVTVR